MSIFQSRANPVFFIAEIGGNHEGDPEYARRLTELAISSGADAVKYQIYTGDTLVSRVENPARNEHFRRFEMDREVYVSLASMCREAGVMFMASVWDTESIEWLDAHVVIYKVGSGDLTAFPVIKALVATGKPLILSTGLSNLAEVRRTIDYIASLDASYVETKKVAVLQCTSSYPCPDEDANLRVMQSLREEFDLPVGYSDHTVGMDAVVAAGTMGAEIVEMHFTDTREGKTFRDHAVSATADEVKSLMATLRRIQRLQGSAEKKPTPSELASGHVTSFRRSVYAATDIQQGDVLTKENLTILRPEHGVPAHRFDEVLGMRASRSVSAHEVIRDEDFE